MTAQSAEAYLDWLEREEQNIGFAEFEEGMADIEKARALWLRHTGMELTDLQYESLKSSQQLRWGEMPKVGARFDIIEHPKLFYTQPVYRIHGKFASWEQVQALLREAR